MSVVRSTCKLQNEEPLIDAHERVLNGALFELGKGCTHRFAPSLPLGSNEAEENRIILGLNPARASETSGRSAATPGLSHARIAAA